MCICRTAHAQSDKCHLVRAQPRHPGQHHSNKIKRARARFSASFSSSLGFALTRPLLSGLCIPVVRGDE